MLDYEEAQKLIFGLSKTKRTEGYYPMYEYAARRGVDVRQARRVIEQGVKKGDVLVLKELVNDAGGNRLRRVYGFNETKKARPRK